MLDLYLQLSARCFWTHICTKFLSFRKRLRFMSHLMKHFWTVIVEDFPLFIFELNITKRFESFWWTNCNLSRWTFSIFAFENIWRVFSTFIQLRVLYWIFYWFCFLMNPYRLLRHSFDSKSWYFLNSIYGSCQ